MARLSNRRAGRVRDYLVSHGVVADRLLSRGYGETKAVADNNSESGRALNRRVEFVLVDRLETKPTP